MSSCTPARSEAETSLLFQGAAAEMLRLGGAKAASGCEGVPESREATYVQCAFVPPEDPYIGELREGWVDFAQRHGQDSPCLLPPDGSPCTLTLPGLRLTARYYGAHPDIAYWSMLLLQGEPGR